jgi:hypothetical protein
LVADLTGYPAAAQQAEFLNILRKLSGEGGAA